ncbi:MAG: SBBP repeat-containing protein, partial [Deltaproteobacteria bacterium]|nr:SBBP repeat-containing protein [Deltaproteobacteria bacterium]
TVDFGGGLQTNAGVYDVFVVCYDASGEHRWSKSLGGAQAEMCGGLGVSAAGAVFVTGYFSGTVDFGGGPLTSAGLDIFLAGFDAAGVPLWSKRFGDWDQDFGKGVAIDDSGSVYLTGQLWSSGVDFGGGVLPRSTGPDAFIAAFSPTGGHLWSKRLADTSHSESNDIAIGPSGNVFVTGAFYETIDPGGGSLTSTGEADVFVASFDAKGLHRWSSAFGGVDIESSARIAVGDNVFVTGMFRGTMNSDVGSLVSAGIDDMFVAGLGPGGAQRWVRRCGGASQDFSYDIAVGPEGHVFMTGGFQGTADCFGGGDLVSAGSADIVVASVDADGGLRWSKRYGGSSYDSGGGISLTAEGDILLSGVLTPVVDFGNWQISGDEDAFLIHLVP